MTRLLVLTLLAACQAPLATPMVSLDPADPHSGDDLIASVAGADEYELAWYRNGSVVDDLTDGVVPASMTRRGDSWRVEALVGRKGKSVVGEASASIRNAPPELELTLAPQVPQAGDALVVAVVAWDADDDPINVQMSWTRDGEATGITTDSVPADTTRRGELWAVEVVANDTYEQSDPVRAEATVVNAAPDVVNARLTPTAPRTNTDLTVHYSVVDGDGDPVTASLSWTVNGEAVKGAESATLASTHFAKGDAVAAVVVATDGTSAGDAHVVGPVSIGNSPPGAPVVRIEPAEPIVGEALRCVVASEPDDADGDEMQSWSAFWSVDLAVYADTTDTAIPNDTVPAGVTQGDEAWACGIRASDGEDWGPYQYASAAVQWDGFRASQPIAGRAVTCASVDNDESWTQCNGLRVNGQAFPNGLTCGLGWSSTASPHTDHAAFCVQITGSTQFVARYECDTMQERVTWSGGSWGTRDDNGYTHSLRCAW